MCLFSTLGEFVMGGENTQTSSTDDPLSSKFLPITTIFVQDYLKANGRALSDMNESIDSMAGHLTSALTQLGSGYTFDSIQYSLREIMRNVFEHSGSPRLRYCAQYFPTGKYAELVISDCGMGIYNSLIGNPAFKNVNERDALHFACLPGVSGNAKAMRERSSGNPWQNSGYGLYMTSRLCRNDGDFLIISDEHALVLKSDGKTDFSVPNTRGTIIRMHLKLNTSRTLRTNLARYTEEGKKISEGIRGAKVLDASVASQMLRRDFDSGS